MGEASEREGKGCGRPRGETSDSGGADQNRAREGKQE